MRLEGQRIDHTRSRRFGAESVALGGHRRLVRRCHGHPTATVRREHCQNRLGPRGLERQIDPIEFEAAKGAVVQPRALRSKRRIAEQPENRRRPRQLMDAIQTSASIHRDLPDCRLLTVRYRRIDERCSVSSRQDSRRPGSAPHGEGHRRALSLLCRSQQIEQRRGIRQVIDATDDLGYRPLRLEQTILQRIQVIGHTGHVVERAHHELQSVTPHRRRPGLPVLEVDSGSASRERATKQRSTLAERTAVHAAFLLGSDRHEHR